VYLWNWSPPAKALNTAGLVGLVLLAPLPTAPALFAFAVLVEKTVSLVTVSRLPTPSVATGP
jgi:CDP-diacylglycerol--glycerol-3-phosphate 3-phosphatidyltransferase